MPENTSKTRARRFIGTPSAALRLRTGNLCGLAAKQITYLDEELPSMVYETIGAHQTRAIWNTGRRIRQRLAQSGNQVFQITIVAHIHSCSRVQQIGVVSELNLAFASSPLYRAIKRIDKRSPTIPGQKPEGLHGRRASPNHDQFSQRCGDLHPR